MDVADFLSDERLPREPRWRWLAPATCVAAILIMAGMLTFGGAERPVPVPIDALDQARIAQASPENEILRKLLPGALKLTGAERIKLAEPGERLGKRVPEEIDRATRDRTGLVLRALAKTWDTSKPKRGLGRPPVGQELEKPFLQFAKEHLSGRYGRMVGALSIVEQKASAQTLANILKRHGIDPVTAKYPGMTQSEFINLHLALMAATGFSTAEVATLRGLVTSYGLLLHRDRLSGGASPGYHAEPDEVSMMQVARNGTMDDYGLLKGDRYVLHDRDSEFSPALCSTIRSGGVNSAHLPARSPNLNAFAERWVKTVKDECVPKLMLVGEGSFRVAVEEFLTHYQGERTPGQGERAAPAEGRRSGRLEGTTGLPARGARWAAQA